MKVIAALALVSGVSGFKSLVRKAEVPVTEVVSIGETEVYGPNAGTTTAKVCKQFSKAQVDDPTKPVVTVCGTSTKVKVYLRNRCEDYHQYTHEVGTCDKGAPAESCVSVSPDTHSWLQTAQSYEISSC